MERAEAPSDQSKLEGSIRHRTGIDRRMVRTRRTYPSIDGKICSKSPSVSIDRRWNAYHIARRDAAWTKLLLLLIPFLGVSGFQICPPRTKQLTCMGSDRLPYRHSSTSSTRLFDSEPQMTLDITSTDSSIELSPQPMNGSSKEPEIDTLSLSQRDSLNGQTNGNSVPSLDVPVPTANGGYSHTTSSKAKISAANKGKTPWNKGRQRTPEERARIAAGVRAKNRERFLKKLEGLGLTEEEYEKQKKEERRRKDAERRARKTENGGYRPTEETRKKISEVLREKYAKGEIKRKKTDPDKVRRGFTHSEETRKKISESLRKRWATDEEYRANMKEKQSNFNSREDVRRRISQTLKQKWQEPEFRATMMKKISNREVPATRDPLHRAKISESMKARWQDAEYRKKVIDSISAKKRTQKPKPVQRKAAPRTKEPKTASPSKTVAQTTLSALPSTGEANEDSSLVNGSASTKAALPLQPISPISQPRKAATKRKVKKSSSSVKRIATAASPKKKKRSSTTPKKKVAKSKKSRQATDADTILNDLLGDDDMDDGELIQLNGNTGVKAKAGDKEIRQDLYDLLYGEDDATPSSGKLGSVFQLGDENLENFDPYGLEDF